MQINRRKKILYIFHVSEIGGGSLCLLNIIKSVDKVLFEPVVLLKTAGPLSESISELNVGVFFEPSLCTIPYNQGLLNLNSLQQYYSAVSSIQKVKEWICRINPDIIHINTMMMYPYAIPSFKSGKKVILHMREHWPTSQNQLQWKLARYIIDKFTHKIIAINETSARILNLQKKTTVIYDWIDFEGRSDEIDLKAKHSIDNTKDFIFLFLGGSQLIKGAYEVVKIFSEQVERDSTKLILLDSENIEYDKKGLKASTKRILRNIGIPVKGDRLKKILQNNPKIVRIPRTQNVQSLYKQAHCVIAFPTIPHAILPIAESIWNGTPVISVDTPEAIEYSDNGKAALLVPMKDTTSLAAAIDYAINNLPYLKRTAETGLTAVQEQFSKKKNTKKLNQVYSDFFKPRKE